MEIHKSGIEEQVEKFQKLKKSEEKSEDQQNDFDPETCDWADDKI